jgi:hypothetical protein
MATSLHRLAAPNLFRWGSMRDHMPGHGRITWLDHMAGMGPSKREEVKRLRAIDFNSWEQRVSQSL